MSHVAYGSVRREMKFAHIREANISHAAGVFHISQKYFTCPQGQISLKKAHLQKQMRFFLELVIRIELMTSSLPMTCSTD